MKKHKKRKITERERGFIAECPYCKNLPVLCHYEDKLYPYRQDYGPVWVCCGCDAFVGCHKGTAIPLGFLANKAYRDARVYAHSMFDQIWKNGEMKRGEAYKRMAEILDIPIEHAHISQLSIPQLGKLVRSLEKRKELERQTLTPNH